MPRKAAVVPTESNPAQPAPVSPPKTEVKSEATRYDDGKTSNELVVQKVSVPSTRKTWDSKKKRDVETTTFKDYIRVFVRPDESREEADEQWDEHEPEDEAALKQLFTTYGKGSGTTISVRMNVDEKGESEFFLDVRHPKPDEDDDDAKLPSVLIDPKASIGDVMLDLFYEMGSEDPPDDFTTRGALEDLIDELKGDVAELEPIRELLDEFDMPGDKPAHLYSLPDRLRSIFRTAKGLDK